MKFSLFKKLSLILTVISPIIVIVDEAVTFLITAVSFFASPLTEMLDPVFGGFPDTLSLLLELIVMQLPSVLIIVLCISVRHRTEKKVYSFYFEDEGGINPYRLIVAQRAVITVSITLVILTTLVCLAFSA